MDVMVIWDRDGSKNVVSTTDLRYHGVLRRGSSVSMDWMMERTGTVLDMEQSPSDTDIDDESDDDIPLAMYLSSKTKGKEFRKSYNNLNEPGKTICQSTLYMDSECD